MLPKNTCLGNLNIIEVYDYLDGPKFFCVRDEVGSFFTVYWCDLKDNNEGWLYLPLSEKRLEEIRRKEITINEAYLKAEKGLYLVYTTIGSENDTADYYSIKNIDKSLIPPDGYYIEWVEVIDSSEFSWDHELKIEKDSKNTTPSAESATNILSLWTDAVEAMMNTISKSQKLHFASASPGSLEVKIGSSNSEVVIESLELLYEILVNYKSNLEEKLYAAGLEPYMLKELFETIRKYKVKLKVTSRIYSRLKEPIVLDYKLAEEWVKRLEPITSSVLGTDKIPQADEIDKIIDIVNYKMQGKEITSDLLQIAVRQVAYYEHAARTLGILNRDGNLTSAGRFLASQDGEHKYTVLASRFESSDCGWAWITWSGVNSLLDLNEETAVEFLIKVVPGLSASTANRRAVTLRQWLKKLKPYHYKFEKD